MAENELKIGVSIDGLPKAESDLAQLAKAEESVGAAGTSAGEASAQGHEKAAAKAAEQKDAVTQVGTEATMAGTKVKAASDQSVAAHGNVIKKAGDHVKAENDVGAAATAAGKQSDAAGTLAAGGHEKAKNKALDHKNQTSPLGGIYENLKSGVLGWLGGYAGFQTVMSLVDKYIQHLEKVREAMRKIADEAQGTTGGTHQLAVQLGDVSEMGFKRAQMIAGQVGEAGGFDLDTANQFAISMDVAMGKRGGIKANMASAKEIAGVAGALNLKSDEVGKLVELLDTSGALESPEKTKEAIAKIRAAFTQSRSTSFGAFAGMLQKGGTGMLLEGMNLDDVLQYAVQTRQVSASEDLAATAMEQFGRASIGATGESDKFLKEEAQKRNLDYSKMNMTQKTGFLKTLFQEADTPEKQDALKSAIPAEVYTTLKKTFAETNLQATAGASKAVSDAKASDIDVLTQGYQKTEYYKERKSQLKRQMWRSSAVTDEEKEYERMTKDAEAEYDVMLGKGNVEAGTTKEAWSEMRVRQKMQDDIKAKYNEAVKKGDVRAQVQLANASDKLNESTAWVGNKGGYSDEKMKEFSNAYHQAQQVVINKYYGQTGGQTENLNQKTPHVRNTPGVTRIGQGDSGAGSR